MSALPRPLTARSMPRFGTGLAAVAALALPLALSACAKPDPLYVDQAWIRLSPNKDNPSGGYFVVHGGPSAVTLRDVITDSALRVEMHESRKQDGMMKMAAVDSVDIPARTDITFAPGGKHIMLWGINPIAVQQGEIPLTFLFSNGDRIIVDAVIQKAGDGAPAPSGKGKE